MKIAIIGGGIAGLSAAWELEKRCCARANIEYRLFEREPRFGGVICTEHLADGSVFETGPDSFLTEKPWAAALCRELGLGDELIGSNDAARKTFIVVRNRMLPLPDGLQFFIPTRIVPIVTSGLFSLKTKLRFAGEFLFRPAMSGENDESVAEFVERHFGREVVERLADPLLGGIYGGNADRLSVRAVLPRMVQLEYEQGSLIRAMLRARKNARPSSMPLFTSLKGGMQQLIDALVGRLNPAWLRAGTEVIRVDFREQQWRVYWREGAEIFDGLIVALPAWAAAGLLHATSAELATHLAAIPYSSSVIVNLAFRENAIGKPPKGFGFLVPRTEGRRMLACTFVHNKFPNRAAAGRALFRCFAAAEHDDDKLLQLGDDELSTITLKELNDLIGVTAKPEAVRIARWRRAMAQYAPGHLDRIAEIERLRRQMPGLALAGNFARGIGVPDCVRMGTEAATELATSLQPSASRGV